MSDHEKPAGEERPKKRRRLACLSCRTAKVKCDWPDGETSCARCKRLGEPCEAAVARPRGRASRKHDAISHLLPGGSLGLSQPNMSNMPLAMAMNGPADDQYLDCEQGITNVFSTRRPMTDVPVDLLREWVLTALHRRDCALLGRAMTISAAAGYTMEGVLGDVSTLATVLQRISSLLQVVSSDSNSALANTAGYAKLGAVRQRKKLSCSLPNAITEMDDGKGLLFVKSCKDGEVQFDTNAAFESCVCSQEALTLTFEAKHRPATKRFLHPEDVPKICEVVGHLWGLIKDQEFCGDQQEKVVTLMIPNIRLWLNTHQAYLPCVGAARLMVRRTEGHCTHLAIFFTPRHNSEPSKFMKSLNEKVPADCPVGSLTPGSPLVTPSPDPATATIGASSTDSTVLSFDLPVSGLGVKTEPDLTDFLPPSDEPPTEGAEKIVPPSNGPLLDETFDLDDLWVEITPEMFL